MNLSSHLLASGMQLACWLWVTQPVATHGLLDAAGWCCSGCHMHIPRAQRRCRLHLASLWLLRQRRCSCKIHMRHLSLLADVAAAGKRGFVSYGLAGELCHRVHHCARLRVEQSISLRLLLWRKPEGPKAGLDLLEQRH